MPRFRSISVRFALVVAALSYTLIAQGSTTSTIPLAPHGDGLYGAGGIATPLTPTSFLVSTQGADGNGTTADDVTLLCTDVGTGTPVVTALATPFRNDYSCAPLRLSATRALVIGAGSNGAFANEEAPNQATADDAEVVHLLDRLGSGNTVTTIPVGNLWRWGVATPERLSASSALVQTVGPDNERNTADDTIALLTDLGGTNTVTQLPTPFARDSGSRPRALSPTSFIVGSLGPDGSSQTEDDVMYLFTDVGGTNTRTELATPYRYQYAPGRAVRVSPSRAVVCTVGPDGNSQTSDDELLLLDGLDTTSPTVTTITVGGIQRYGGGRPVVLNPDVVVIAGTGPDETQTTADDRLIVVSGLGTTNTVTPVIVDYIGQDAASNPVRLSDTACALASSGPDGLWSDGRTPANGLDDEVAIVTGIGGAIAVDRVVVPGLDQGAASEIVPLSADAFMVCAGGADGVMSGSTDDVVHIFTGVGSTPTFETLALDGAVDRYGRSFQPHVLGRGRAVFLTSGPDQEVESGGDDLVQVVDGLPGADQRGLTAKKVDIKFKASKPEKPTKMTVKGTLLLDGLRLTGPVTISIGNAAQTIPESALTRNQKGVVKYRDKKNENGFIRSFTWNPKNGKLSISGRGVDTAAETTDAGYVAVAVQTAGVYLADVGAGESKKSGIKYRAPR